MNLASSRRFLEVSPAHWSFVGFALLFFAATNLPWHLDDYDQAKQAFTSFEMVKEGHWFYQRTPNDRVATKPPLVGWTSAAIYTVSRSWEAAWRLPSFLSGAALLLLLATNARRAYGASAGFLAAAAFGLNLFSPRLATLVRTDMPLALIVFLLGLQIWRKLHDAERWQPRDRLVAFLLLTASMLIKGPIVCAFLLPGIAVLELRRRRHGGPSAWCGWRPWVASFAIFALWAVGGIVFAPGFYEHVVLKEFAGRFTENVHRPQPFLFYVPHLLHKFAPWSILMAAIAVVLVRAEKLRVREWIARVSPSTLWLICWAFGGLVVMSFVPSKRVDRIFPIVPPLCLLLAAQFAAAQSREQLARRVRQWCGASVAVAFVFSGAYSAYKIFDGYRNHDDALVRFGGKVRDVAASRVLQYESLRCKDEGMLLYLRRLHFLDRDAAIADWRAGKLNAVVAPNEEVPQLLTELPAAEVQLQSEPRRDEAEAARYSLLVRR